MKLPPFSVSLPHTTHTGRAGNTSALFDVVSNTPFYRTPAGLDCATIAIGCPPVAGLQPRTSTPARATADARSAATFSSPTRSRKPDFAMRL